MHISLLANDLHCRHCNWPIWSDRWPLFGDRVGFVFKDEPGQYSLEIHCPYCKKNSYVVWDLDPGPIRNLGFLADSAGAEEATDSSPGPAGRRDPRLSDQATRDKIMSWIGPTAVFATPPLEDFIALGPDAIPAAVDIFSNPQDIGALREFWTNVDLPILVRLLDHYARHGNTMAGQALFDIANGRIQGWGQYGQQAQALAYELAQTILDARKV